MKKKGFTLIELLAVIVILAIIALISTPIIIGVIDKAKKGAFEDSAYGVIDAGRLYFINKLADNNSFNGEIFDFTKAHNLKLSGEAPAGGTLALDNSGKQALAIYDKDKRWCAIKAYEEEKVTIKDYKEEECKIVVPLPAEDVIRDEIGKKTTMEDCNGEGILTDLGSYGIRYQGKCPNNFVTFNGEQAGWRIIGIVDGKIKLLRNSIIGRYAWDNKDTSTGAESSTGKNDWSDARLMKLLNPGYESESIGGSLYWNRQAGNCYAAFGNASTSCDFTAEGLADVGQNMIADATWYLGGDTSFEMTKAEMYRIERGNNTTAGRPKTWIGKVGLVYPSDFGFSAKTGGTCTDATLLNEYAVNGGCMDIWFFEERDDRNDSEWTISPASSNSYPSFVYVLSKTRNGLSDLYAAGNKISVRPSVYLKSEVKITGGTGTKTDPYLLSL